METIMTILDYFQYDFIWRGFWVGLLVAILGAMMGHFLVLRKVAMIGHGLSHVAYLSVALAIVFFQQSLIFNLIFVAIIAFLIQFFVKRFPSYADVVIGVISSTAVAIGTILITTNPNQNVTVEQFLFGSLLLLRPIDVGAMVLLAMGIVLFIRIYYQALAALSFDPDFARVVGMTSQTIEFLLTLLTAWLIVLGIRSVGALLISSFIMFPTLIVSPLSHSFKGSFVGGIFVSIVVFLIGFLLSLSLDWPTGSTIIVLYAIVWVMTMGYQTLLKERMV
jgi:zinc transport system permease protein